VQSFIDRFRFNAKRAALVQSRIKALERMAEVHGLEEDPETVFRFPPPAEATGALMSFDDGARGRAACRAARLLPPAVPALHAHSARVQPCQPFRT
jgi:ATPase subunit of ABC transporter with duplicated ATPase domains